MSKEEIFEIVKNCVVDILPDINENDIKITDALKDLGANSIDRMDVTIGCMKALKLKVPMIRFGNISNIQGLVDVLYEECNAK